MVLPSFPREPGLPSKLITSTIATSYDVALANGFVGTEAEWLASLIGPTGPGVPDGGATGQVLAKTGTGDQETGWTDQADPDAAIDERIADGDLVASADTRIPQDEMVPLPTYARVWVDADNRIAMGMLTNGQIELSSAVIGRGVLAGVSVEDDKSLNSGYTRVHVDRAGRIAEDALDRAGRVPDWVLAAWSARMDALHDTASFAVADAIPADLPAVRQGDGTIALTGATVADYLATGDSITAGYGDEDSLDGWVGRLETLLGGPTVTNYGRGGWASTEIALLQGGVVPLVTVTGDTVPASGAVALTAILPRTSWKPGNNWVGYLDLGGGVTIPGTLSHAESPAAPWLDWTFTRTTSGDPVAVPPQTPFVCTQGDAHTGKTLITMIGRNNNPDNVRMDAVRDVQAQILRLAGPRPRYLVLSIITMTTETAGSGVGYRDDVLAVNRLLSRLYGDRYVDVRRHLIDYGLDEAGITPTADDLVAINGDTIPPSLMFDTLHPNAAGYTVVANKVYDTLVEKGWAE